SGRGDIVLDLFGGSGSTLIAAHKTGRRAFLSELDPVYCDRIIRRWEIYAKDEAERIAGGIEIEPQPSEPRGAIPMTAMSVLQSTAPAASNPVQKEEAA